MFFARKNWKELSDEVLMKYICQQEEGAFAELYDRYSVRMHRFFCRMSGGDSIKANDFNQELFLKIIEKPQLFDPKRKFSTWFYTVASNIYKNDFRKVAYLPEQCLPEENSYAEENIFFTEALDKQLFEKELRLAIEQLDDLHKRCFVLRYAEGLSIREIADIEACPEGTIKSRLHHALRTVRSKLHYWICSNT